MKIIGVIPSRYKSTRFPGKPLININGKTMIQRVYEQAGKSKKINSVVVATDDRRIYDNVKSFNGNVIMTSGRHKSGTDRIVEAVSLMGLRENDIIVNIQGDEPFINPRIIDRTIEPLIHDKGLNVCTAAVKLTKNINDKNKVKVIIDNKGNAVYFSRLPIPFNFKKLNNIIYYKHLGLYVYRKKFLFVFKNTRRSQPEIAESLEQLRILDMRERIKVIIAKEDSISIDTKNDYKKISFQIK